MQDTAGFLVLRRLTTINMHCAKLDVYQHDKNLDQRVDWRGSKKRNSIFLTEHIRATQHRCRRLSDGWKCMVCRTFTSRALLEDWLNTPCPGVVQTFAGVRSGRRLVHVTHRLRQTRGVLWCKACGHYAVNRCDLLASRCMCIGFKRQPSLAGKAFLKRVMVGLPPAGYARWPDEDVSGCRLDVCQPSDSD